METSSPTTDPDLKAAFGSDVAAAQQHWLRNGIAEGRDASAQFSIGGYVARYADVQKAYSTDYAAVLNHWFTVGQVEKPDPKAAGTYMADPRADVLDPVYYSKKYPDLNKAFGYKVPLLVRHWLDWGAREGRSPNAQTPAK
ncbi:MAG: hypothetical protein RLZZ450_1410 [Pseudomonadota bacterium]|jgi:hypothetical protein